MPEQTITMPEDQEVAKVEANRDSMMTQAKALATITTPEQAEQAGELLTTVVKPYLAEVDEAFGEPKKAAYKVYKMLMDRLKQFREPGERAEHLLKGAIVGYHQRVEAERRRREQEAREREERERREREEREARILARAEAAMDDGDDAKAEELMEQAERAAGGGDGDDHPGLAALGGGPGGEDVDEPIPERPEIEGVAVRTTWDYEVLDAGELPAKYVQPDRAAIRKVVNALGRDAVAQLGGERAVRVFPKTSVAARNRGA